MPADEPSSCPDCGAPLSREAWALGLCVPCLADQARRDSVADERLREAPVDAPTEPLAAGAGGEAPTMERRSDASGGAGAPGLRPGAVLGDRYRIRSQLGAGGMGEVWQAFDLKLRVDVALKSLLPELTEDRQALEMLRQEVRLAREVISPNVCRVFDLQEVGGQEWIAMEYVDGRTLAEILRERGPLALDEARELASQFLAGLEAIHDAGLVHRDVKPENLMVTRAGRVVVMDFGIAKSLDEGRSGVVSGTPAYMSPEQSGGGALDARADVYAAGVVLAEMVAPGGVARFEARRALWEGIHAAEPEIAETPWAGVIRQAVAPRREDRQASASVLARALEEVTLRAVGDDEADPYPGLAAFAAGQAEYFFGRELEVEALWKKLRRPQLQALIAPSGAGKSSFLRAGVLATLPEGWRGIVATPGRRPFAALAQALELDLAGEGPPVELHGFEDPEAAIARFGEWRRRHAGALIVVDQFEELFTQNAPDAQAAFADLLGRLPLAADVHVLLAMREDFHFHCQRFESLAPVFSETTPLGPLGGSALRRALVQPALKCGYRFEDDSLVDEMLAEVSHERGALPLLAFAAAQMWRQRDRDSGLLTRRAYEEIGGVGGALGRHAEATLERIGRDREAIVRELFRNLVTAQGTRAARDRGELLSVFEARERETASGVLDTLIDARLLTSYEEAAASGGQAATRLEIVHESLLARWPRLVRWRTQDAEGAQLRDDLRQTAQRWRERGRPEDLLWTGTSFREYELWRERYSGGLSQAEEEFARAMQATAERRKRRRRLALGAAFAVLLAVLAVVGGFWRHAVGEARRAEAQKLLALGQLELDGFSTATLAYATRSIDVADSSAGRELALEALWRRPPTWVVNRDPGLSPAFSPDGRWLVQGRFAGSEEPKFRLTAADGGSRLMERIYDQRGASPIAWLSPDRFLSYSFRRPEGRWLWDYGVWSASEGRAVGRAFGVPMWETQTHYLGWDAGAERLVVLDPAGEVVIHDPVSGERRSAGLVGEVADRRAQHTVVALTGRWIATAANGEIVVHPLRDGRLEAARPLGRHGGLSSMDTGGFASDLLVTRSDDGEIKLWQPASELAPRTIAGPAGPGAALIGPRDSILLVAVASPDQPGAARLWSADLDRPTLRFRDLGAHRVGDDQVVLDPVRRQVALAGGGFLWARLDGPAGAAAVELQAPVTAQINGIAFDPQGRWLAGSSSMTFLWPLDGPYPSVVAGAATALAFDPRGRWLASDGVAADGRAAVRVWDLEADGAGHRRELWRKPGDGGIASLAASPDGRRLLVGVRGPDGGSGPLLVSLADGTAEYLPDGFGDQMFGSLSADGRFAAASGGQFVQAENLIKVWDLESRELVATLAPEERIDHCCTAFTPDNDVLWAGTSSGLWRWSFEDDRSELVYEGPVGDFSLSADGRHVLMRLHDDEAQTRELVHLDLASGEAVALTSHGDQVRRAALDRDGRIVVSADQAGVLRVGLADGSEPHRLYRHRGEVSAVGFDPRARWVVSVGREETRFWPLPDVTRAPAHTLPKGELLALLRAQTNARLVENPESSTGWVLDWDPFPGWERTPPPW